jgi:hypothetical protein
MARNTAEFLVETDRFMERNKNSRQFIAAPKEVQDDLQWKMNIISPCLGSQTKYKDQYSQ